MEVLALRVQSIIILCPLSYAWNKNYWVWTKEQSHYGGIRNLFHRFHLPWLWDLVSHSLWAYFCRIWGWACGEHQAAESEHTKWRRANMKQNPQSWGKALCSKVEGMSILQLQPCQQSGEQTDILVSGDSLVLRPGFQNGSLMGSRDAPDWSKTEKKGQWVGCWGPVGATTAYSSTVCSKRKHCCLPHSCSPRLMDIFLCGLLGPGTIVIQTQKEKPSVQLS